MEIRVTIEDKTTTIILLAMAILLCAIAIAHFIPFNEKVRMYLVAVLTLILLIIVVFTAAIQICYALTAKSIALSAIQLEIEEEKRKEEETKKAIEEKKYECASKILRVQIVEEG